MIVINGVTYPGNNVSINNNKIIIDGKVVDVADAKEYKIEVYGENSDVRTDSGSITVHGTASSVNTVSGSVSVGKTVQGNVSTVSGSVRAVTINGSVSSISGSILR